MLDLEQNELMWYTVLVRELVEGIPDIWCGPWRISTRVRE